MLPDELKSFQGIDQFGPAYRTMLERDSHAPGSVDRVILDQLVRLCPETADYLYREHTPTTAVYERGSRPQLEKILESVSQPGQNTEETIAAVAGFCSRIGRGADNDNLDTLIVGGTEEQIIARRFDWCTDVARVGCILTQVAGLPSRLVFLANTDLAYSGHVIIEAYRDGRWAAVDTSTCVLYRDPDGRPATTWHLMNSPDLIDACGHGKCYSNAGQFRAACIVNYSVAEHPTYDYATSGVNDYYRSILEHSARGWPAGLRWIHGEDSRAAES